jgi:hypothetical protein
MDDSDVAETLGTLTALSGSFPQDHISERSLGAAAGTLTRPFTRHEFGARNYIHLFRRRSLAVI